MQDLYCQYKMACYILASFIQHVLTAGETPVRQWLWDSSLFSCGLQRLLKWSTEAPCFGVKSNVFPTKHFAGYTSNNNISKWLNKWTSDIPNQNQRTGCKASRAFKCFCHCRIIFLNALKAGCFKSHKGVALHCKKNQLPGNSHEQAYTQLKTHALKISEYCLNSQWSDGAPKRNMIRFLC